MPLNYKEGALELKIADDDKTFSGYGAIYENRDDGHDIIEKGAFDEMRLKKNGRIRIAVYHDTRLFVGDAKATQDSKGVELSDGKFNHNLSYVQDQVELVKDGTLDAFSVGFNIPPGGAYWDEDQNARVITKGEAWEFSFVPFGMNRDALVADYKSAGQILTIRHFEAHLKSIGFTRKQSAEIALHGWGALQGDPAGTGLLRDASGLDSEKLDAVKHYLSANPIQLNQ